MKTTIHADILTRPYYLSLCENILPAPLLCYDGICDTLNVTITNTTQLPNVVW